MKDIFVEVVIKVANVKDYIFTIMEPSGKKVKNFPFDKRITAWGTAWLKKIKKWVPELKVNYVGSSALKLPGQKDIDFVIECSKAQFKEKSKKITKKFGKPFIISENYIEWRRNINNKNIDILMTHTKNRMYLRCMDAYIVLSKNKKMYNKYLNLKLTMNGKSYKEYELKRSYLFNEVFYKYGRGLDFIFKR